MHVRLSALAALTAALVLARLAAAAQGEPARHACPGALDVVVRTDVSADAQLVCEGVQRALRFLSHAGLQAPPATTIDIVPQLPGDLAGRAVGCYLRSSRSILLLSLQAFQAGGDWFRLPADAELYKAAAAHEMAHAVVGCQGGDRPLPVAAHEYVAYVVLFATMDPALRERVLARFPGTGFTSTLQINDLTHIVQPNQFGVDAWRHYLRRRNRDAWLREVIAGQVVQELFVDGP